MAYSEEHIALAAEYALGTLDADERSQVETMMSADNDFTAMVQSWEYRLGVLNQMVGSVEPRPIVWENIRTAIGHAEPQAPIVLPEAPPPMPAAPDEASEPVAPIAPAAPVVDNSNVIWLSRRARRWRSLATSMTALAGALVAVIGIEIYLPDLLPERLRPKPRTQLAEVRTPALPQPPSAQY